jgi:hypothetical protein
MAPYKLLLAALSKPFQQLDMVKLTSRSKLLNNGETLV